MKYGDRVRVIAQDSEWFGCIGTMSGLFLDGTVAVTLDKADGSPSEWIISFDPFELEMEELYDAERTPPIPLD